MRATIPVKFSEVFRSGGPFELRQNLLVLRLHASGHPGPAAGVALALAGYREM